MEMTRTRLEKLKMERLIVARSVFQDWGPTEKSCTNFQFTLS